MKETPIIFTGESVRAIIAGRKTQTRRLVKPQPPTTEAVYARAGIGFNLINPSGKDMWRPGGPVWAVRDLLGKEPQWRCPYGAPGDALWVKETFAYRDREYHPEGGYWYAATDDYEGKSVSPLFMPRAASRITLRVTSVRAERVQAISEADAMAEGVDEMDGMVDDAAICRAAKTASVMVESRAAQFGALWDSINGKRAPWSANPWVWVVGFEATDAAKKAA